MLCAAMHADTKPEKKFRVLKTSNKSSVIFTKRFTMDTENVAFTSYYTARLCHFRYTNCIDKSKDQRYFAV